MAKCVLVTMQAPECGIGVLEQAFRTRVAGASCPWTWAGSPCHAAGEWYEVFGEAGEG